MKRALALVLVAGCRTSPAPTDVSVSSPTSTRVPDEPPAPTVGPSTAGFVVFTSDESYVLPVNPDADLQRYAGLFVGGPKPGGEVLTELALEVEAEGPALHLPYCVDALEESSCGRLSDGGLVPVLGRGGKDGIRVETPHCECVTVEGISDDGIDRFRAARIESLGISSEELETTDLSVDEYIDVCYAGDRDLSVVAIASGVVHSQDMFSSIDCGDLNIYSLYAESEDLREGGPWKPFDVDGSFTCFEELGAPTLMDPDFDEEGCRFGEDDCCPDAGEGLAHRIISGQLFEVAGDVTPVGSECGCVRKTPVTAESCTSAFDPCGSAERFPGLRGAAQWWVATDGAAGLGVDEAGTLHLFSAGVDEALRIEELGLAPTDILGVEFLPFVPAKQLSMAETLVVDVPTSDETPQKGWGNLCFARFKEGRLDAAEAACLDGLLDNLTTGDDKARGALLYSLGRIEEARGHQGRARLLYERSLGLRPGNAAVEERLRGLGG